jgi:hypothetical protein
MLLTLQLKTWQRLKQQTQQQQQNLWTQALVQHPSKQP